MAGGEMGRLNVSSGVGTQKVKVAILSAYTAQNLQGPLERDLRSRGFDPSIRFGGFGQFNQELRDGSSWLARWEPDIILVAVSTRSLLPEAIFELPSKGYEATLAGCMENIRGLTGSVDSYGKPAKFILTSLEQPTYSPYSLMDFRMANGVYALIQSCNDALRDFARNRPNIILLDFDRVCGLVGKGAVTDEKMYHIGRILLSSRAASELASEVSAAVASSYGKAKKCIVVDLDNTIWGGVVGEVGPHGINVSGSGSGAAYTEVQKVLLNFKRAGMLLCIASKNNEQDAREAFEKNADMVLSWGDFAAKRVNWRLKSENLMEMASELNIGLDSMVFVDDNPAERLEVGSRLPAVEVVDFPSDVSRLPHLLKHLPGLKTVALTDEDRKRHEMYVQERGRQEAKVGLGVEDYLRQLETRIEVRFQDADSMERITQLVNKTNQFNLRTVRYSRERISAMMDSEDHVVASLRVWDRFGDMGLTGVIILQRTGPKAYFIDSFLLSCRILSRGIERQFFKRVVEKVREKGATLTAEYIPTQKNSQVEGFYESLGFALAKAEEGRKTYSLPLDGYKLDDMEWIEDGCPDKR